MLVGTQVRHIYKVARRNPGFFRRSIAELVDWVQGHTVLVYCEHGAHRSIFVIATLLVMAGCRPH